MQPISITNPKARWVFEEITKRTLVMGILNVTPDSFSDGGTYFDPDAAVSRGIEMAEQGADIIDVGGESTRPGAEPIDAEEEIRRVLPVIKQLAVRTGIPISIDTYRSQTAAAALDSGASIINDISAMTFDANMKHLAAERKCPIVLMHIKGTPQNMQQNPHYENVIEEIIAWLKARIEEAESAGIDKQAIIIDPGIGFGKTVEHNLEILNKLDRFRALGKPILVGVSRKRMIGEILGGLPVEERLEGTAAAVAISIANGANIVRVHDVKEMARVVKVADAIVRFGQ
jgi:dihydropteroate synthase